MILAGWTVYAAIYLGFALASAQWHIWLLFVGYAVFYAFTDPAEKTLVANLVGPDRRGLAYGWFNAAVGIGTLPASLLFGWLYQDFGALTAFGVEIVYHGRKAQPEAPYLYYPTLLSMAKPMALPRSWLGCVR